MNYTCGLFVMLRCVAHQCELYLLIICLDTVLIIVWIQCAACLFELSLWIIYVVTVCCSPVLIIPVDYLFGYGVLPACLNYPCGLFMWLRCVAHQC